MGINAGDFNFFDFKTLDKTGDYIIDSNDVEAVQKENGDVSIYNKLKEALGSLNITQDDYYIACADAQNIDDIIKNLKKQNAQRSEKKTLELQTGKADDDESVNFRTFSITINNAINSINNFKQEWSQNKAEAKKNGSLNDCEYSFENAKAKQIKQYEKSLNEENNKYDSVMRDKQNQQEALERIIKKYPPQYVTPELVEGYNALINRLEKESNEYNSYKTAIEDALNILKNITFESL